METYLVINTSTSEVYQRNGRTAEFATYHQARQVRITMNDQGKVTRDIEGTTSTWVDRPTPWQIIESSTVTVETTTIRKDRKLTNGAWARGEEIVYIAKGDLNPIKRNPSKTGRRRNQGVNLESISRNITELQSSIKRLKQRVESIEKKMEEMETSHAKIQLMERKIGYKKEIIRLTAELREKQSAYMSAASRKRRAQNNTNTKSQAKTVTVRRRTS